jgi:hypothetical protein
MLEESKKDNASRQRGKGSVSLFGDFMFFSKFFVWVLGCFFASGFELAAG